MCRKIVFNGYIELCDIMGNDEQVAITARVSTGSENKGDQKNQQLINYMMRHGHSSPFEFVEFKFKIKCPIFVARQWFRTRMASYNEMSGRYQMLDLSEIYKPEDLSEEQSIIFDSFYRLTKDNYSELLNHLPKEQARIVLPVGVYTEFYWKIDLNNLFKFLKQRLNIHAQYEIREYAKVIAEIIKEKIPMCYSAFEKYELNAIKFSQPELELLKELGINNTFIINKENLKNHTSLSSGELSEFLEKVTILQKETICSI